MTNVDTVEDETPDRTLGSPIVSGAREAWQGEPANPDWTAELEDNLVTTMARLQVPTDSLGEVSCKQTLCRLTFLFDDPSDGARLLTVKPADHEVVYATQGDEYEVFLRRTSE